VWNRGSGLTGQERMECRKVRISSSLASQNLALF
jgi:hypothetical protein